MWVLSLWWVIWRAMNYFLFRSQPLDPFKSIGLVRWMLEGPTIFRKDMTEKRKEIIRESPTVISNDQDLLIYSDATFKASDGKSGFWLCYGPKWCYFRCRCLPRKWSCLFKRGRNKGNLVDLQKEKGKCFDRVHMVSDVKDAVHSLKEDDNWFISPIILDINYLFSLFSFVDFSFILKSLNGQAHKLPKPCYSIS